MNALQLIALAFTAMPYVVAFGMAILLCLAFVGCASSVVFGVGFMTFAYVASTMLSNAGINLGITLFVPDIVLGIVGLVVGIRFVGGKFDLGENITRAWVVLGLVWFGLFAVGLPLHKTLAGVAFRSTFYAWVAVAYLLSFRVDAEQQKRIVNVLMWGAVFVCLIVAFRWAQIALGIQDLDWRESATSIRVVSSAATEMLALAVAIALAGFVGLSRPRGIWLAVGALCFLFILILQHRTVWAVALATVGAAFWLSARSKGGNAIASLLPLVAAVLVVGSVLVLAPRSDVSTTLQRTTAEIGQERNTLSWRVDSWRALLTDWVQAGPKVWPFGQPFGTSMVRYIETNRAETSVSAHSNYISLLVNGGLVGLGAFLFAQVAALRRLIAAPADARSDVSHATLVLLIVSCMVYALTYGWDFMQGLFLGLAYTVAARLPAISSASRPVPLASTAARPGRPSRLA